MARQLKFGDRFFRGRTVRLISDTNEQLGLVSFEEALERARVAGLDLVEIAGKVEPPVCRIMDYGKHQYEESKRLREAKRKQVQQKVKEVKLHPNIDDNDLNTKTRHVIEFLSKGDKVKILLVYRGREMAHPEIGQQVVERLLKAVGDAAVIDSPPRLLVRNYQLILAPKSQK
ncbi:MAG TPA: translation initiation factor IF-3 [Lentisphaeria bacterium]|nr:translation initiation factor IF-3 [Lentisphaeria bacterium]